GTFHVEVATEEAQGVWRATFITSEEPIKAAVEPHGVVFDVDRFNNTTEGPGLQFFPGSARNLSDEDYTLFWLPYFFRRPSEPFAFGLHTRLMRYLHSHLYLRGEVSI